MRNGILAAIMAGGFALSLIQGWCTSDKIDNSKTEIISACDEMQISYLARAQSAMSLWDSAQLVRSLTSQLNRESEKLFELREKIYKLEAENKQLNTYVRMAELIKRADIENVIAPATETPEPEMITPAINARCTPDVEVETKAAPHVSQLFDRN